jgi:F-type H+-transporting ATPase subunit a
MCLVLAAMSLLFIFSVKPGALVPSRAQSVAEETYLFVTNMLHSTAGPESLKFFPFVFTLFAFVLCANLFGMVPYAFTVTSHIIVTVALALTVFFLVIVVGLWKHGLRFFSLFVPDAPLVMMIILVPIEVISFLSRPLSLSVRLFANMLAGHIMLKVFGGFVVGLAAAGGVLAVLSVAPLAAIVAVAALELLVAFLQAYIFAILTCIYLGDAINLHDSHH